MHAELKGIGEPEFAVPIGCMSGTKNGLTICHQATSASLLCAGQRIIAFKQSLVRRRKSVWPETVPLGLDAKLSRGP